ncbi:hypothetical protein M413DRAFT_255346 [Hebeloma cylindrosporum]|uniref:Acyltransferase 3 domain-containing protein n=1 Tax=Hebeloma cylindrosporum TaxID=76867 RepID=A0A0C3C2C9_HEBCY|nr:hypothetical protein M413DRAFT_255346 [Hebeloma cylindrosporum h7]
MEREHTPLLGPIHLPSPTPGPTLENDHGSKERVHFLDNLRTILTVLLIFHHAAIESGPEPNPENPHPTTWDSVAVAMFQAVNKCFLWGLFFFVSGCSTHLSILSKRSDMEVLRSKVINLAIPAIFYSLFGRTLLLQIFNAFGWWKIFGHAVDSDAVARLAGPVSYIFALLLLDGCYFLLRAINTSERVSGPTSYVSAQLSHRNTFLVLFAFSFDVVLFLTFFNVTGIFGLPSPFNGATLYDYPGLLSPLTFILAYATGLHFDLLKEHVLIPSHKVAWAAFIASEVIIYMSLGAALEHYPALWDLWKPSFHLPDTTPTFGFVTLFFSVWSTFTFYALFVAIVSVFVNDPRMSSDWGVLTKHTYILTYVHMEPILVAVYILPEGMNTLAKAGLVGLFAVLDSWGLVYLLLQCRRLIKRISRT